MSSRNGFRSCARVFLAIGITITILVAFTGCGKKQPAATSAYEINGVKVDIPALQAAFVGSPFPDIQAAVNDASSNLRYGQYVKAFHSLDKVASDPNLTEPQKRSGKKFQPSQLCLNITDQNEAEIIQWHDAATAVPAFSLEGCETATIDFAIQSVTKTLMS